MKALQKETLIISLKILILLLSWIIVLMTGLLILFPQRHQLFALIVP